MADRLYDEPAIVFTVRQLLEEMGRDFNKRMDELAGKLDDRVTVAVFRALRSDLDATLLRIAKLEATVSEGKGAWWAFVRVAVILWALATTALSVYLGVR